MKQKQILKRYPNLNTILMVEKVLKNHQDLPMKLSELKTKLPKQVMHQTLIMILEYLHESGKIIYGPKGIQWIYAEPEHLKKMMKRTIEV
jgi:hypothetical protein